jgi:hypothetical protein
VKIPINRTLRESFLLRRNFVAWGFGRSLDYSPLAEILRGLGSARVLNSNRGQTKNLRPGHLLLPLQHCDDFVALWTWPSATSISCCARYFSIDRKATKTFMSGSDFIEPTKRIHVKAMLDEVVGEDACVVFSGRAQVQVKRITGTGNGQSIVDPTDSAPLICCIFSGDHRFCRTEVFIKPGPVFSALLGRARLRIGRGLLILEPSARNGTMSSLWKFGRGSLLKFSAQIASNLGLI